MPGKRKAVWRGIVNWPEFSSNGYTGCCLLIRIPDKEPGRLIEVAITKEQAKEIGLALWQWGSE